MAKIEILFPNSGGSGLIPDHNNLNGLQGLGDDYIHLNQEEYDKILELPQDYNFIPLSGTLERSPILGDLEFSDQVNLKASEGSVFNIVAIPYTSAAFNFDTANDFIRLINYSGTSKGIVGDGFFDKQNDLNAFAQLGDVYDIAENILPIGTDRQVLGYDSGIPTPVTLGWKQLSDLPTPPTFNNGVYVGTAFQPDGSALFAFVELGIDSDAKPTTIPIYNSGTIGTGGGTLKVQNAINSLEAVNLGQVGSLLVNKADLVGGIIPSSQLPSSIDDVLDGTYINSTTFNNPSNVPYVPMTNAIYVDTTTNLTYRWSGTAYIGIGNQLALGETSSTAYRGDRGKIAYDHSQIVSGNPHGVTLQTSTDIGATTTNNVGFGIAAQANSRVTSMENAPMGVPFAYKAMSAGSDIFTVSASQGVRCNNFGSIGTSTMNITGNGQMFIQSANQNSAFLRIGNPSPQTTSGGVLKTFNQFVDNATAATGTGAKNWIIIDMPNTINLANQSGAGIVRCIYFNPTVSNIGANQYIRAFESTNGGGYFNTTSVDNSAILQADSNTQGFLPPRMTEAQKLAIVSPAIGLVIFQTNNMEGLYVYKSTGWDKLVVLNQIVNGNTISSAGTLSVNPVEQNSYYTFQGTTSTWTLGTLANTANKFISLINMGSGNITLNTNAGGNDIWDGGSNINTMMIPAGTSIRLYNNSLKFIIL